MKQADRTPEELGLSATAAPPSGSPPDDERVVQVMHEYLAALETGQTPERAAFLARYPEIAHELADCLEGLDFVHAAGVHGGPGRASAPDTSATTHQATATSQELPLGDYRIVREIGQGGMGVVYEAVQLSLNRRVALKVLPFAAALDSRQLQRFKNEAHAAAQLHHTNIVPVYGVGSDRGIHYYAMQFIDGQTLAQMISQLKQNEDRLARSQRRRRTAGEQHPVAVGSGLNEARTDSPTEGKTLSSEQSIRDRGFFRTLADLGIQAAEALEHAHQFGVIHRDIKPANLLIEHSRLAPQSSSLRLWITDFGLAHCQSNVGLTMTGDLVGTLRYMSPEQALAKRVLVDHRTDIYSLGVTLYELLTLEPVFGGSDRQELLRQIAFEEPKAPRRVNRAIPSELETIVLKAVEKNPSDRYATAQELADDLARFLRDESIRARRPTVLRRLRKLARRHPGVTATAGLALLVVLVLTALGLAANNLMIRSEQERTQAANKRLQDNLKLSLEALDETFQMLQLRLPRDPEEAQENEELLTKALGFYEKFADRNKDEPSVRREVVDAYIRASDLHLFLGHHDQNEAALSRAADMAGKLMADFPADVEPKWLRAKVHLNKGLLDGEIRGRLTAAQEEYRKGIALLEASSADAASDPKYRNTLADLHYYLSWSVKENGNLPEAQQHSREAIKLRRRLVKEADELAIRLAYMQSLAMDHNHLAVALTEALKLEDAEDELREVISLLTQVDAEAGKLPGYRRGRLPKLNSRLVYRGVGSAQLGAAHHNLGIVLRRRGRSTAAAKEYLQSVKLWTRATHDWPRDTALRRSLANSCINLGQIWFDGGKRAEAAKQYRKAFDLLRTLDAQASAVVLINALWFMGDLLHAEGNRDQAAQHYRKLQDILEEALARSPEDGSSNNDLAMFLVDCADRSFHNPARAVSLAQKAVTVSPTNADFLGTLGVAQYRKGQWQAAVSSLNEAKQLHEEWEEADWLFLAMAHWQLGDKKTARACYDRGAEIMKRYEWPRADAVRWRAEAAAVLGTTLEKPKAVEKEI